MSQGWAGGGRGRRGERGGGGGGGSYMKGRDAHHTFQWSKSWVLVPVTNIKTINIMLTWYLLWLAGGFISVAAVPP